MTRSSGVSGNNSIVPVMNPIKNKFSISRSSSWLRMCNDWNGKNKIIFWYKIVSWKLHHSWVCV